MNSNDECTQAYHIDGQYDILFRILGQPEQKGSMRVIGHGKFSRMIPTNAKNLNEWTVLISHKASEIRQNLKHWPMDAPIHICATFYLSRAKNKPKTKFVPCVKSPDLDKLIRSICDALTGILYTDDRQVVSLLARKEYSDLDEPQGVELHIHAFTPSDKWWMERQKLFDEKRIDRS